MKKQNTIIAVCSMLALALSVASAQTATNPEPIPPESDERPELPPETKALIVDYRTEQLSIRSDRTAAVGEYLDENPDATPEEIRAVVEAFNQDNADRLAAQAEIRQAIREDIREFTPDLPEDLQDKMIAYRGEAERLRTGRREAVSEYVEQNPDASAEEIRTVVADYNRANAEDIVANAQLRREIRRDVRDLRDLPEALPREVVTHRRQQIRQQLANMSGEMKQLRQETREQLQEEGANRREIVRNFIEARREILAETKEAVRDEVRADRERD